SVQVALSLLGPSVPFGEQPGKPAVSFTVGRISQQTGAIHKVEPAPRDEAYAVLARRHVCPHDAREAVAVRNGHRAVAQCRGPFHQFTGVRRPTEEAEVRRYLQFHIGHTRSFLSKESMQKPFPRLIVAIMPLAEKPVPPSLVIF